MLPVEAGVNLFSRGVQPVEQRLCVARQTRREHHDFKQRGDRFQELVAKGSLLREHLLVHHLVGDVGDVDCHHNVSLGHRLELRVNERLVEVKDEHLLASLAQWLFRRE